MKLRPTAVEVLVIIAIVGIFAAVLTRRHHVQSYPVKEQEMFGYWIAIPRPHSAFRLFLTNSGAGLLGCRDIYTNLWKVSSWQVTNREISIDLAPITEPTWPNEYIRGKVFHDYIKAVYGGDNQKGEHWERDIIFYREDTVRQDFDAAAAIMTNAPAR